MLIASISSLVLSNYWHRSLLIERKPIPPLSSLDVQLVLQICRHCSALDDADVTCVSLDCPVFYERVKVCIIITHGRLQCGSLFSSSSIHLSALHNATGLFFQLAMSTYITCSHHIVCVAAWFFVPRRQLINKNMFVMLPARPASRRRTSLRHKTSFRGSNESTTLSTATSYTARRPYRLCHVFKRDLSLFPLILSGWVT